MICCVPISDENSEISGRLREGDGDRGAAEDPDTTVSASGFVESEGGEIVKASDLILHLHCVSEVLPRRNWTCCSVHSVLE